MKNFKFLIAAFTLLALTNSANAGTSTHGGDAVTCFANVKMRNAVSDRILSNRNATNPVDPLSGIGLEDVTSVSLLDMYFLKTDEIIDVQKATWQEILAERMAALSKQSSFADIISDIRENELRESNWFRVHNGVVEIPDEEMSAFLPDNCLLLQMANQRDLNGHAQVFLEERLFDRLPEVQKAALYFHEWIYRFAYMHTNLFDNESPVVRETVATIFNRDFDKMNSDTLNKEWNNTLKISSAIALKSRSTINFGDRKITIHQDSIERDDTYVSAQLANAESFNLNGQDLRAHGKIKIDYRKNRIAAAAFDDDFTEHGVLYKAGTWLELHYAENADNAPAEVLSGVLAKDSEIDGLSYLANSTVYFSFNKEGHRSVQTGELAVPAVVDNLLLGKGSQFQLKENGRINYFGSSQEPVEIPGVGTLPPFTEVHFFGSSGDQALKDDRPNSERIETAYLQDHWGDFLGMPLPPRSEIVIARQKDQALSFLIYFKPPNGSMYVTLKSRLSKDQKFECLVSDRDTSVQIYSDRQVKRCVPKDDFEFTLATVAYKFHSEPGDTVEFHLNGVLKSGYLAANSWINGIPCTNLDQDRYRRQQVEFYDNQSLKSCTLFKDLKYRGKNYSAFDMLIFDESGNVTWPPVQ